MKQATHSVCDEVHPVKFTARNIKNFWRKVDKQGPLPDQTHPSYQGLDPCWIWKGALNRKGYGQRGLNGKLVYTHRFAWLLFHGDIPEEMKVLHRCDCRNCVNPSHLFIGTDKDNARDREEKGRGAQPTGDASGKRLNPEACARGNSNGRAKLSEADIREMRSKYAKGGWSHQQIADAYGIDKSQAGRIIRRQFWKHVV